MWDIFPHLSLPLFYLEISHDWRPATTGPARSLAPCSRPATGRGPDTSFRERTRLQLQGADQTPATGRGADHSYRERNRLQRQEADQAPATGRGPDSSYLQGVPQTPATGRGPTSWTVVSLLTTVQLWKLWKSSNCTILFVCALFP